MNDFENLLNSDEVVDVKDKYDGKFVSIKVSDFANDLAYYSIQAYGFGYNYESFSYVIPPAYYDNHRNYVENVDKTMKEYIANNNMFNNIFIEYALNNPKNILLVENIDLNLNPWINILKLFGSFAYQSIDSNKKSFDNTELPYNNLFLNYKSFIEFDTNEYPEMIDGDLIYKAGDEYIVKVHEKDGIAAYIIADTNKPDNIDYKTLNTILDKLIPIHYPNETKSKQNKLKDYGLFTQEFYLKSFNKKGIKFEPKSAKEIVEKSTDTPELTTVLNTEVLSITNISEGKSEIIRLLSDISNTTGSSIEDVINGNTAYDNKLLDNFTNIIFDKTSNNITITERNYLEQEEQQSLSDVIPMLKEVLNDYNKNKQVEVETPIQQTEVITPQVNQDKIVTYTPIGKTQQTYTIRGSQIFNKDGIEVFKEDSRDRNKIFANLAIQEKRAVIVTWKDNKYVVNNNNKIISVKTGDYKIISVKNEDYKGIIAEANKLFKSKQPESQTTETREYTPENITSLKPNEIFVFGSNAKGVHGKGAALLAKEKFGAIQGKAEGLQGQSYGVITKKDWRVEKSSTLQEIGKGIQDMLLFAKENPNKKFLVTKLGSSLAGYSVKEIKNLFEKLRNYIPNNVILPKEFEVRDMPGVDSQFIEYLQEIGAKFTVYHTGDTPRIKIDESQQSESQTTERIQKVYPEQIKLNSINIKVSTSKLQELANLVPDEIVEITNKDNKYVIKSNLKPLKDVYSINAETYVERTNSDIYKNEGEFLLNNPEFAKYFIEDYLIDEEGDGKTMQEYAQKLLDKNVTYKDTYQLDLFNDFDTGNGFNSDNCLT